MTEKAFQSKLIKLIEKNNGYVVKFNASAISKIGVPDLLACINGKFVGLEVKKENGKPSEIQLWNIEQIKKSGGIAMVVKPSDYESVEKLIKKLGDDNNE